MDPLSVMGDSRDPISFSILQSHEEELQMNRLGLLSSIYMGMTTSLRKDAPFTQVKVAGELWFGVGEYSLGPRIVKRNCT